MVLVAEDQRVVDALVIAARPLVNYAFYQELANRIDAASARGDEDEAKRVGGLREHILEFTQQLDQLQQAVMQESTQVLSDILASDDIAQAVAERADYIDQNFLSVLAANLQQAEQRGATAAVQRLQQVWDAAIQLIQEDAPPEVRLINELLNADYPGETRKILSENRTMVTAAFIESLTALADEMDAENSPDLGSRLRQIRSQAQLMR